MNLSEAVANLVELGKKLSPEDKAVLDASVAALVAWGATSGDAIKRLAKAGAAHVGLGSVQSSQAEDMELPPNQPGRPNEQHPDQAVLTPRARGAPRKYQTEDYIALILLTEAAKSKWEAKTDKKALAMLLTYYSKRPSAPKKLKSPREINRLVVKKFTKRLSDARDKFKNHPDDLLSLLKQMAPEVAKKMFDVESS